VPGGELHCFEGTAPGPWAKLELREWGAADELLRLSAGGAPAYLNEGWDSPDLAGLLTLVALNDEVFRTPTPTHWWDAIAAAAITRMRPNVHARYRLGNEFYRQWLDPSMTYSAAVFDGDRHRSLEQAQTAKFERILQALNPLPGQSLLDIGCGWGGFAEHAASRYGCRVDAITLSRKQVQWARQRIQQAQLQHAVNVEMCDFREVRGRYDFVVSIEAYEVIGQAAWGAYFETIARCLRDGGRAFLQAGVVADRVSEGYRDRADFIPVHIHPRARLASWPVLEAHAERAGLRVSSNDVSSDDYVQTLRCWRERFNDAWPQLTDLGLDRRFQRLWNFYLAYCEARYRAGTTLLLRVQMDKPDLRGIRIP
jgi:cyclopropane-fatty-acyl-phospholipid synthase